MEVINTSHAAAGIVEASEKKAERIQLAANHEWLVEGLTNQAEELAYTILQGVRRMARHFQPTRFQEKVTRRRTSVACGEWDRAPTVSNHREVLYLDIIRDKEAWKRVMEQVQDMFRESSVRQITLTEGNDLYHNISDLIPWEIARIQLARAPAARRPPTNFPFTHRAGVFLHNDSSITVESEDIQNITFPRQKFAKPVKLGIIVYGQARDDEQPQQSPQTEIPQAEARGAEISFPECSVPRDIKRAVARLHVNLGHPTSNDLVRMLALHGSITPQALSAAKKLCCASCERMRQAPRNRPSKTVKYLGQLGDNVLMDIFYARDVKGENYTMLGVIDEATNLHQVRILPDKNPTTVLEAFKEMWVRPYGAPYKVTLDQDGSFEGDMWEYLVRAGIETEYVPAEAHYKLGKAERNNTVFREALNRTADSMAAADLTSMEEAGEACIYVLNSVPRTRGMSAYSCAFGKIPRMPGDLLTDENSLAVDVDEQQHRLRSMIFRAEAQKAVADVNVDMHLRRALLRKTAHMRVDDITPGAKVAVWRSQLHGRSTKKRGGYVIGKLIAWDGASAWIQIGWRTIKVDRAQMRPAYGFETWVPDQSDIQALKDAEQNFIRGEVQEEIGEGPPEEEPIWFQRFNTSHLIRE